MNDQTQPTVVLLAALNSEIAPVLGQLKMTLKKSVAFGQMGDVKVIVKVTGMGRQNAVEGLRPFLDESPAMVIHPGFAGGLDPNLNLGDLVRVQTIIHGQEEELSLDAPVLAIGEFGRLITVDDIVDSPAAKQKLHQSSGAHVVDMESHYVARLCQERNVPYIALRVVSDSAQDTLPSYIANWINSNGSTNNLRAIRDLILHPSRLPLALRLGRDFNKSANVLAGAVIQCIEKQK